MKTKVNITEEPIENILNKEHNYDIEDADTLCPVCKNDNKRFWLTFYNDDTLLVCRDCGYYIEI